MSQYFTDESGTALPNVETLTGDSGGAVGPNAFGNINLFSSGGGISIAGTPASHLLTFTVGPGGLFVVNVTTNSQAMSVNTCYINNNPVAGSCTMTLPATAALGDIIEITGVSANRWVIAQNAGQVIHFNGTDTTVGVGGSISSNQRYDCIKLRCSTANTNWVVVRSEGAVFTIV